MSAAHGNFRFGVMGRIVQCCGSNGSGQLGVGHDEDLLSLLLCIFDGRTSLDADIRTISCGGNHTMILDDLDRCWASGDNLLGQCGHNGPSSSTFICIPGTYSHVACGWEFSILVDTDGNIWSCGHGPKGELGVPGVINTLEKLKVLSLINDGVHEIRAGLNHVLLSTKNGEMYGWGVSRKGQLGESLAKYLDKPTKLTIPSGNFRLGRDFSVVDHSGKLNVYGKFDHDLEEFSFDKFDTMWTSIHWLDGGNLVGRGNDRHSQIVCASDIESFVTGSEHGLALKADGVYAWGWGEHGNCGILSEGDVTTNHELVRIGDRRGVVALYGGLATSWVVYEDKS